MYLMFSLMYLVSFFVASSELNFLPSLLSLVICNFYMARPFDVTFVLILASLVVIKGPPRPCNLNLFVSSASRSINFLTSL